MNECVWSPLIASFAFRIEPFSCCQCNPAPICFSGLSSSACSNFWNHISIPTEPWTLFWFSFTCSSPCLEHFFPPLVSLHPWPTGQSQGPLRWALWASLITGLFCYIIHAYLFVQIPSLYVKLGEGPPHSLVPLQSLEENLAYRYLLNQWMSEWMNKIPTSSLEVIPLLLNGSKMAYYVFFITITLPESRIRKRPEILHLEKSFFQKCMCGEQVMWKPRLVIRTLVFMSSFCHIPGYLKHWRVDSKILLRSGKNAINSFWV